MDFGGVTQASHAYEYVYSESNGVSSIYPKIRQRLPRSSKGNPRGSANMILNALPADLGRALTASLRPVILTKEQFLYQEDDRLDFIYFPDTAVVSEFKILEDGRMVEIAVTGREGAIGLSSIYSESYMAPNFTEVSQAGTARRMDAISLEKLL